MYSRRSPWFSVDEADRRRHRGRRANPGRRLRLGQRGEGRPVHPPNRRGSLRRAGSDMSRQPPANDACGHRCVRRRAVRLQANERSPRELARSGGWTLRLIVAAMHDIAYPHTILTGTYPRGTLGGGGGQHGCLPSGSRIGPTGRGRHQGNGTVPMRVLPSGCGARLACMLLS